MWALSWNADGKTITSGGVDDQVHTWDPLSGLRLADKQGDAVAYKALAWSPDGSILAGAGSGERIGGAHNPRRLDAPTVGNGIFLWSANSVQPIRVLLGHSNQVMCLSWSPDGTRLASGGQDGKVFIWNPLTGESVRELKADSETPRLYGIRSFMLSGIVDKIKDEWNLHHQGSPRR